MRNGSSKLKNKERHLDIKFAGSLGMKVVWGKKAETIKQRYNLYIYVFVLKVLL